VLTNHRKSHLQHTGLVFSAQKWPYGFEPAKEVPIWHTVPLPALIRNVKIALHQSPKVSQRPGKLRQIWKMAVQTVTCVCDHAARCSIWQV